MSINGWARVTLLAAIHYEDLPVGPGKLVTGWFEHVGGEIMELQTIAEDGIEESFFVTATHPFWSVDRNAWVPVCELRGNERLSGVKGHVLMLKIASTARIEPVYNIEVEGDHC